MQFLVTVRAPTAGWLGGLLRDLRALAAITAPSVPSLARLRPGYFASAYQFWGVENREAPLRYVLGSELIGADHANVELKVSDASANPYLVLAAVIAAGLAGLRDGADPGEPIQTDPGRWSEQDRAARGLERLPTTPAEQEEALTGSKRLTAMLGEPLLGAFLAVRRLRRGLGGRPIPRRCGGCAPLAVLSLVTLRRWTTPAAAPRGCPTSPAG